MFDDSIGSAVARIVIKLGLSIAVLIFGMKLLDFNKYTISELILGSIAIVFLIYMVVTVVVFTLKIVGIIDEFIFPFVPKYSIGDSSYGSYEFSIVSAIIIGVLIYFGYKFAKNTAIPKYNEIVAELGLSTDQQYYVFAGLGLLFFVVDVIRLIAAIRNN